MQTHDSSGEMLIMDRVQYFNELKERLEIMEDPAFEAEYHYMLTTVGDQLFKK